MYRNTTIRRIAIGVVLSAVGCAAVSGQSVISVRPAHVNADIDRLHTKAEALFGKPSSYGQAALMLKRAADLQTLDEVGRVTDRALAANLWYYAGERTMARNTMKQAAEEALGQGSVAQAAGLFTDACFIAIEQKNAGEARELYAAAVRLAKSNAIKLAQQEALLKRLATASGQVEKAMLASQ